MTSTLAIPLGTDKFDRYGRKPDGFARQSQLWKYFRDSAARRTSSVVPKLYVKKRGKQC